MAGSHVNKLLINYTLTINYRSRIVITGAFITLINLVRLPVSKH